jgi:hypothetical protein
LAASLAGADAEGLAEDATGLSDAAPFSLLLLPHAAKVSAVIKVRTRTSDFLIVFFYPFLILRASIGFWSRACFGLPCTSSILNLHFQRHVLVLLTPCKI